MDEVLATGMYCTVCEYFEDPIEIDFDDQRCMACGCSNAVHRTAKIIAFDSDDRRKEMK